MPARLRGRRLLSATAERVDDEDEFADHRERWAYPEPLVEQALSSCAAVERAIRRGEPPFDGETHLPWLARLTAD